MHGKSKDINLLGLPMDKYDILVVEDEEDIQELLRYALGREGYNVRSAYTGEEALSAVSEKTPDLILLDLMLPGMDGLEVCRRIKGDPSTQSVPIVMLTAKAEDVDIVTGLEVGADDYVTKPFGTRVLIARIRAVLRRKGRQPSSRGHSKILKIHDIVIDTDRHEVTVSGRQIKLTYTEFKLLHFLAKRPGVVFSRNQILHALHGDAGVTTDRSVDVQVVGLRRKLGAAGKYIETVRGVGYRFRD